LAKQKRVAMFLDYESLFYGLLNYYRQVPNPRDLVEIASRYGSLIIAKAFADFTEPKIQKEMLLLKAASIEVIQALSVNPKNKNNMTDFMMLGDIYRTLLNIPNIDTFIIGTGDGHFLTALAEIKYRQKKEVVVIGVKNTVSQQLSNEFETILLPFEQIKLKEEVV
jgi:uncharacterized LabA/DUF88 family protein